VVIGPYELIALLFCFSAISPGTMCEWSPRLLDSVGHNIKRFERCMTSPMSSVFGWIRVYSDTERLPAA
jgi:hypothetical protein